ncbi:MAG TPA: PEGA domain-containing protein [Methanolinea sp.]|nr:PEGA domain-containing protein [Methanolinea sp.]HQK56652.1 PEGA domain-containing protein [Methanolinea sp.]
MQRSYLKCVVLCVVLAFSIPFCVEADTLTGGDAGIYRFHVNVEGAEGYVDGQMVGVVRNGLLDLPLSTSGTPYRTYSFRKEGYYTYNGVINSVPAKGQLLHIYVTMTAMPIVEYSRVHLLVSPTDAKVTWDGEPAGEVPPTGILIIYNVVPGTHTVKVTKEGYLPIEQVLNVARNDVMRVPLTLQPVPLGSITFESVPAGASVFLDGQYRGVTPLVLHDIPAGSHSVTLTSDGFQDAISAVQVTSGGNTLVSETMNPATPVPGSTRAAISPLVLAGALAAAGMLFVSRRP